MIWILIIAVCLFIISIILDKIDVRDWPKRIFYISALFFGLFFSMLLLKLFIPCPPIELIVWDSNIKSFLNSLSWLSEKVGGYSILIAVNLFLIAIVSGLMFILALFVDDVDRGELKVIFFTSLIIGLIFVIGFNVFIDKVSLIVGLVSAIIGIIVGLKIIKSDN